MKIWTQAYRPFLMGGDVNAPICCELNVEGHYDLGKGYYGCLVISPSGKTYVVEAITGGIVGRRIKDVRYDVEVADTSVIAQQIEDAKLKSQMAEPVSEKEFWRQLNAL